MGFESVRIWICQDLDLSGFGSENIKICPDLDLSGFGSLRIWIPQDLVMGDGNTSHMFASSKIRCPAYTVFY